MLTMLRISGLAIVDKVEVAFGPGLNVLTGETGAGKSILLEALHLVLGGRMAADVLREGAEEAVVEALFELPFDHPVLARLAAAGLASPPQEPARRGASGEEPRPPAGESMQELLVRRTASRSGRGRAFVNGALCTIGLLERCLAGLVDVTGQHEHVALLDESTHVELLDAFAGVANGTPAPGTDLREPAASPSLVHRYRAAHGALLQALRAQEELFAAREERARRADYLAFQLRELEAVRPEPGEDEALERERQVLASAERLREAARAAEALVYGEEGSSAEGLGRAVRSLSEAAAVDARLEPVVALLRSALAEAEEAGRGLAHYADSLAGDPERLFAVEERLEALRALARKHGGTLGSALARTESMRAELAEVEGGDSKSRELEGEVARWGARAVALARELSAARVRAAQAFARAVGMELVALAMARCRVEVAFLPPEQSVVHAGVALGACGSERAQILLAPNPGEPARPLARIASGGELSRVLLAAKRALAGTDRCGSYVFDEVDSGLGGAVAEAVGRLLQEVARDRQVVCVTHLPQVASHADRHLKVEKRVENGRTVASVRPLGAEEREGEVARMLAGAKVTGVARDHARELIDSARRSGSPRRGEAPRAKVARRAAAGRDGVRSSETQSHVVLAS